MDYLIFGGGCLKATNFICFDMQKVTEQLNQPGPYASQPQGMDTTPALLTCPNVNKYSP
jgi:hypothetical protein